MVEMQLNIKNPEVNKNIAALASLLHVSKTEAVGYATKKCLAEEEKKSSRKGLSEQLLELSERCAPYIGEPWKSTPHGDLLYDELGLPK